MQDQLVLHPSLETALLCSRGHILSHFGPELRPELPMSALLDCLKNETTQLTAIRAHNTIARCLTKLQWKSTHPVFCVTSRLCLVLSVCCAPRVVWACCVLVTPPCFISWTCCQVSQLCGPFTNPGKPWLIVNMLGSGGRSLSTDRGKLPALPPYPTYFSIAVMCIA